MFNIYVEIHELPKHNSAPPLSSAERGAHMAEPVRPVLREQPRPDRTEKLFLNQEVTLTKSDNISS